jgi:predicted O-methyltransferase YrrM
MPTPLCQLARKYGSDKFSTKHSYTRWYYDTFAARRESVRKVVEIGVGEGASLRMWREFFPNAHIYGGDNEQSRLLDEERITCYPVDQSSAYSLELFAHFIGADIDLFIDDGSHKPSDQFNTCRWVMPLLKAGATYVIEDVAESPNSDEYYGAYPFEVPDLERRRRYDNRLVVVRHAHN